MGVTALCFSRNPCCLSRPQCRGLKQRHTKRAEAATRSCNHTPLLRPDPRTAAERTHVVCPNKGEAGGPDFEGEQEDPDWAAAILVTREALQLPPHLLTMGLIARGRQGYARDAVCPQRLMRGRRRRMSSRAAMGSVDRDLLKIGLDPFAGRSGAAWTHARRQARAARGVAAAASRSKPRTPALPSARNRIPLEPWERHGSEPRDRCKKKGEFLALPMSSSASGNWENTRHFSSGCSSCKRTSSRLALGSREGHSQQQAALPEAP